MNNLLFVVTHKQVQLPEKIFSSPYKVITVGEVEPWREDIWSDKTNGIPEKNSHYCELTAHYWVWKNKASSYDNIGLCHYRRFFTKNGFTANPKYYLSDEDIDDLMSKYEVILPKKVYRGGPLGLHDSYICMSNLLKDRYPKYFKEFEAVRNGHSGSFFNMFIMRSELFNEYSNFMFEVLSKYEEMYPPTDSNKRIYGYLSEHLIDTWVNIHKPKMKRLPLAFAYGDEKYQRKWAIRTMLHINAVDLHEKFNIGRKA